MAGKQATLKSKQREVRREELLRYLSENNRVQHIIDSIEKIEDVNTPLEPVQVQRLKTAMDARISLLKKYLPDMKAMEIEANVNQVSHEEWIKRLEQGES